MKDKILDEFNNLIKDLTNELLTNDIDPYGNSVDTALAQVVHARRSYQFKKANDQRVADFKRENPNEDPKSAVIEGSSE
ncbi:hypothetical protein [Lactobacillus xujianguonis]|nr:hypothetical protein [Lactobacillus xujianguonis]RVU77442.1 hypothetical protein EJK20_01395 [Lactobacillus xujianguonis]